MTTVTLETKNWNDGECREFTLSDREPAFCVRHEGQHYCYRNNCPHTGATLNWVPNQFLTVEGDLLQCAVHGALFRIEDGLCIQGPCIGERLLPLAVDRLPTVIVVGEGSQEVPQ